MTVPRIQLEACQGVAPQGVGWRPRETMKKWEVRCVVTPRTSFPSPNPRLGTRADTVQPYS
jgi:hypothetical protein